jgi:hypothetical protein
VSSSRPLLALVVAAAVACEGSRDVAVRVSIPGPESIETPASAVGLVALPYDRDSVLASLDSAAGSKRPATAELDSLFAAFRGPFNAYSRATLRATSLADSLAGLKTRLDSLPRNAPEYGKLFAAFERVSDSLTAANRAAEAAKRALDQARATFVPRSESLRAVIQQWEDSTYRGYDSLTRNLAARRRQDPVTDTTDARGWANFRLGPGKWWIYGQAWDVTDPNQRWYWNIPAEGDTVLLSSRNGERRPRY